MCIRDSRCPATAAANALSVGALHALARAGKCPGGGIGGTATRRSHCTSALIGLRRRLRIGAFIAAAALVCVLRRSRVCVQAAAAGMDARAILPESRVNQGDDATA